MTKRSDLHTEDKPRKLEHKGQKQRTMCVCMCVAVTLGKEINKGGFYQQKKRKKNVYETVQTCCAGCVEWKGKKRGKVLTHC